MPCCKRAHLKSSFNGCLLPIFVAWALDPNIAFAQQAQGPSSAFDLNDGPTDGTITEFGTYAESFAIDLPPGRRGISPVLALKYDSGDLGRGRVGIGWKLHGLPAIVRSRGSDGLGFANGSPVYALAASLDDRPAFRARLVGGVGGMFTAEGERMRFSQVGTCGSGPCYWVVKDGTGRTLYFGGTPTQNASPNNQTFHATVWEPHADHWGSPSGQPGRGILAWLLVRVEDLHGNAYAVSYGVDGVSRHPQTIVYPEGSPSAHTITFAFTPANNFVAAPFPVNTLLNRITIGGPGAEYHRYELSYDSDRRLERIRKVAGTLAPQETTYTWLATPPGPTLSGALAALPGVVAPSSALQRTSFKGDVDGDGREDLVRIDTGSPYLVEYWKNGLSFYSYFNAAGLTSPGIRASFLGEIDGDGRADLLLADAHPDRLVLRIHRGQSNGLASTESVASTFWINLPQPSSTWRAAFADYNGDQLTDVALVRVRTSFTVQDDGQGRVFLFLSNGQGGYSTQEAGRFAFPAQPSLTDESSGGKLHLVSLDSNGDRCSDLCVLTYLSNPTKLQAACQTGRSDVGLGALTLVADTQIGAGTIPLVPPTIGDVNGDGMSEILVLTTDGTNSRLLRGGTSGSVLVSGYVVPAPPPGTNATALAAIADVDNDGTGDLIRAGATPNSMWIAQYPADRTGALGAPQKVESPSLTLTGQHVPQLLTADVANAGAPVAMLALHALNGGTRFLCSSSCGFRHLAAPPAWGPDASTKPRAMTLNRTGEGRPDLILMNEGVGGSQPRRVDRLTQTGAFVNRISRRVGTMGDSLDISYRAARLFADAISRTSATCIPSCGGIVTDTRPLVSQMVRSNGRGFTISHTLDYVNGRRRLGDHSQRAELGFQQIKLSQTETARTVTTDYYQVHPYDRLVEQRISTTGGLTSTEEYFLYDYVSGAWNTIPRVLLTEVDHVIREGGQLERADVTRYEYDSYLNRTSVETCSNGTNCRKRQTKFALSPSLTSQWLISRPEFGWVVSSGTGLYSMERYTFGTTSQLAMTMAKVERLLFTDLESAWCAYLPGNPEGRVPCGEEVSAGAARWVETLSVSDWTPEGLPQNLRQMGGETATLQYGNAQQSLPTQVFQPSLGTVTIERDLVGREIAWVDGAGVRRERPVNALGRPTSLRAPGLPQTTIETYWYNSMGQSDQHVLVESIRGSGQTTSRRVQYFDGFGSVYRTAIPTDAGPELREDQTFAWNGGFLTRTTTYPYFSNAGPDGRAIQVKYDSNGRPLVMNDTGIPGIGNNGVRKRKEWIYSANQVIEKDALGELRTFQYNQAGQLWRVTDSGLTNSTVYTYDRFNNISLILLPNGDREEFSYDGWHRVRRHRVISATRPVASDLQYEYYDSGELKSRTNAASQQVTYSYDTAGRITSLAMGSDSVQFNYSGTGCLPGRLCSVTAPRWSSSYDYDGAGRIFRIRESVDGEAPRVSIRSMEPNGTLTGESTPQGSIQYIRTREGRLKFLNWNGINVATADNYLASGLPQTIATGDGVIQTTLPDQFDRPEFLTSQGSGGLLLEHVRYTYDGADRLEAVADNRDPLTMERYAVDTSQTASFVYDERNRLASASQAGQVEAFSYDDLGYPTYFEDLVVTYSVCGARRCVIGTTLTGVTAWTAEYDSAGRQTKFSVDHDRNGTIDEVLGFDFDALDRLVAVRNGAGGLIARYTYTPDGRRFLVEAWHGNELRTTKTYFGGLYTVRSSALAPFTSESTHIGGRVTPSAVATTTRLHWAPTQAALTASAYQSQQGIASSDHADGLLYAHRGYAAQLGFVVRGTDGQEVARYSHSAFGQLIADRSTGRHIVPERFGGGADDPYSPLIYNRSRFYNPYTGLFASADDRVVGGGIDAQGFNRHSFVLNGPSMYFDPSGHQAAGGASTTVSSDQSCNDIVCGLIAGAVAIVGGLFERAGDEGEVVGRRHGRNVGEKADNGAADARQGWMRSQSDVQLQLLEMEKEFYADNSHFADRGELTGAVVGRFVGEESVVQAASMGSGWLLGRVFSAAGRGLATFGARLTAGGWGFAAGGATGRVATRINLANGPTRFTPLRASGSPVSAGWQHVLEGHFNREVANSRSVFSVAPDELRAILQSPQVVGSPVTALGDGQFLRTVDVGRTIGTSSLNNGGGATSVLRVFTDEAGNLITAFPH